MSTFKAGDRLKFRSTGRLYVATCRSFIADYDAPNGRFAKGDEIVVARPINPATGKAWQYATHRRITDFELA